MGLNFRRGRDADSLHAVQMQINGQGKAVCAYLSARKNKKDKKKRLVCDFQGTLVLTTCGADLVFQHILDFLSRN